MPFIPNPTALDRELTGADAIAQSGIVASHAQKFQNLCKATGWFVIFRGVNHDATALIADNYPVKDMGVHGKSSNWGPQAGFICMNQFFSKVVAKGATAVNNSNAESPLSIEAHYPAVPLVVSDATLNALKTAGRIQEEGARQGSRAGSFITAQVPGTDVRHRFKLVRVDDTSLASAAGLSFTLPGRSIDNPLRTKNDVRAYLRGLVRTINSLKKPKGEGGEFDHLYFVQTDERQEGYPNWYTGERGKLLLVIASRGTGRFGLSIARHGVSWPDAPSGQGAFYLPLTADYDIFTICPPLWQLMSDEATKLRGRVQMLSKQLESGSSSQSSEELRGERARARWKQVASVARGIREVTQTRPWGAIADYQLFMLHRLNEAAKSAGYKGGLVCHHGVEQENLHYAEVDPWYTLFTPGGRVYCVPPRSIEAYLADIDLLGYTFYTNPAYRVTNGNVPSGSDPGYLAKVKLPGEEQEVIVFHNQRGDRIQQDGTARATTLLRGEAPVHPQPTLVPQERARRDAKVKEWASLLTQAGEPMQGQGH